MPNQQTIEGPPLLLTTEQVAQVLGMSPATVLRLRREGIIPQGRRVGTWGYRWSRDELVAWVRAGCPERAEWEAAPARRGA